MQFSWQISDGKGESVGTPASVAKVDNPYRSALQALKTRLKTETEELKKQLETASKDMAGKKVWVGKAADSWQQDLDGRRARIKTLVDKLIPAVDAEIAKAPEKVSPGEAKMWRMDMQGY
ncbi:hypothetical protein [Streptomyces sp. SPB162]|uniref:hypothetical protein n=1 Tax=Streptomyces sp. SPB162 TaxID=2940560 RepID=UPI002404CBE8|nr:hypothetical protein [Streptomyces sp. SPB162]MDF9813834.1 uncharacterized protein YukE [Streptomyces sp. SPB162]